MGWLLLHQFIRIIGLDGTTRAFQYKANLGVLWENCSAEG